MIVLLIVAASVYMAGSVLDALSSIPFDGVHVRERTKLFMTRDGKFSVKKYAAFTAGGLAAGVAFAVTESYIIGSGLLVSAGVYRFVVSVKNRKVVREYQK